MKNTKSITRKEEFSQFCLRQYFFEKNTILKSLSLSISLLFDEINIIQFRKFLLAIDACVSLEELHIKLDKLRMTSMLDIIGYLDISSNSWGDAGEFTKVRNHKIKNIDISVKNLLIGDYITEYRGTCTNDVKFQSALSKNKAILEHTFKDIKLPYNTNLKYHFAHIGYYYTTYTIFNVELDIKLASGEVNGLSEDNAKKVLAGNIKAFTKNYQENDKENENAKYFPPVILEMSDDEILTNLNGPKLLISTLVAKSITKDSKLAKLPDYIIYKIFSSLSILELGKIACKGVEDIINKNNNMNIVKKNEPLNSNNNNSKASEGLQIESDSEFSSDETQVVPNTFSNNYGQQKSTLNSNNNNNNNFITSSEQENSYQPKASNNFKLDTKVALDVLTSAMLLNEHISDWLFENKSITHATEFAIAGTATVGGYVYGINPLDASLPVVRATAYTAKDIAHSRKASTIDAIKTYINVEGHEAEVGLLVDIAFSAAIAYASPVFGMTFLLFGASSLINYLEENVSANSYSNIASNAISKGTGVVAALTHMACNKNMVTQHSEHPIYNAVGYFLATNYAYQVSDKVTTVGQSYTNMTPEFLVETMDYIANTLDSYGL